MLVCANWGALVGGVNGGQGGGACGVKEEKRGSGGRGEGRSKNCQRYVQAIAVTFFNKLPFSECLKSRFPWFCSFPWIL